MKKLLFGWAIICSYYTYSQTCFYGGTGADLGFNATVDTSIISGTYNYTTFNINPGVNVTVTGANPLEIFCSGAMTISGTLSVNGQNGFDGITYSSGGNGGLGVAGGGNGGNGSFSSSNGPITAGDGSNAGGINTFGDGWSGGGGAGYGTAGTASGGATGGFAGTTYGAVNLNPLLAGSGAGGGSGGYDCGAGGGGAGGGIIIIHAYTLTINSGGVISSNGGNGGSDGLGNCGGGGGGSGGSIWIESTNINNNGTISAIGGIGGSSQIPNSPYYGVGGNGGNGRIRIDGTTSGSGNVSPTVGFSGPIAGYQITNNTTVCFGDSIVVGANTYTNSGNYSDTLLTSNGCDSIIHSNLTVLNQNLVNQSYNLCFGETITVGTSTHGTTGVFNDTLIAANGCDSVVITNLTVNALNLNNVTYNLCEGESVNVGSNTYNTAGVFIDSLVATNGCDSIIHSTLNFEIVDLSISVSPGTLTSNATNLSYQWIDCANNDSIIQGETNQSFTPLVNGLYAVILNNGNCTDTSACVMLGDVGLEEMNFSTVSIFPNPTNGNIQINSDFIITKIVVRDAQGRTKLTQTVQSKTSILDMSDFAAGVYFISSELENKNLQIIKVIKE